MDVFQLEEVQGDTENLGGMAGVRCRVAHVGHESGADGLPSHLGGAGCSQSVAPWYYCPHDRVV
jgi:hypothetical protein